MRRGRCLFEGFQGPGKSTSKEPGDVKWMCRASVGYRGKCGVKMHCEASLGGRLKLTMEGKRPQVVSEVQAFELF